ncbi:MAG TPA: ATP-binding protein [Oligoflexia bacterium]|nr:ATP-binding protein [Oligoflexia bacterium]HMP49470.1 ATP-binding protein [Oligoflexia bacterium]
MDHEHSSNNGAGKSSAEHSTQKPASETSNSLTTRYIGKIFEIIDSTPRFSLETKTLTDETGNIEIGAYCLVQYLTYAILAQIVELSASARAEAERHGRIELLASIDLDNCELIPGVSRLPSIGAHVFLASEGLVQALFEPAGKDKGQLINLGSLNTRDGVSLSVTPDMLFAKHLGVVGATGSGKSNTVAKLVEECLKLKSKLILLDPSGEYGSIKSKYAKHVHLGELEKAGTQSKQVVVPYYHLTESDLTAIFKPTGQSQAPKLRAAMKSLKLAILSPGLAVEGNIMKADKEKRFFEAEYARHIRAVDNPLAIFDISKLPQQIENECVKPNRSAVEPLFWGAINPIEVAHCTPLVVRVSDIISADEISCIFNPGKLPSLLDEIEEFIDNPSLRVLRVSLETLPFLYNAREIVSNAIGRQILLLARQGRFKKSPVVIMMDEAHQFLNSNLENDPSLPNIDAISLIAKEGRKYGSALCLATQRPKDIPESILSQLSTYIIHRVTNQSDLSILESASGNLDPGMLAMIPSLGPGKCLIMGSAVPFPMIAQIEQAKQEPDSETPSFSDYWRN